MREKDIVLERDLTLAYENGAEVKLLESSDIFTAMKQVSLPYVLYALLTPARLQITKSNSDGTNDSNSIPIGFVLGPGLVARNVITASSANRRFKKEIIEYNLKGKIIKKGETVYGIIGIRSDNYDAIKIKT